MAFGSSVGVFVLDFKHAFMTVPLASEEMPYNTSVVPQGIRRSRAGLDETEPESGKFLVWRVLGFGGHANPLIYARLASFAARSGQALLFHPTSVSTFAHGRLQLYVDDPAIVLCGDHQQQIEAIDVLIVWWLLLGIPLSWKKGFFGPAEQGHTWIGVHFKARGTEAILSLPQDFLIKLTPLAQKFSDKKVKVATLKEAQELCGRAGRLAQVIPAAKPFINNLYGALAGSLRATDNKSREAPPGKVATRRYRSAAAWLCKLLANDSSSPLVLQTKVLAVEPTYDPQLRRVEFDASPFGGAAVLYENNEVVEYFTIEWEDMPQLGVRTKESIFQFVWEFLTLALAACRWCPLFDHILLCGDNTASLNLALSQKSRGLNSFVGRELAWRKARYDWRYAVAHLPAEANALADRLSRLADPNLPKLATLPSALIGAAEVMPHLDRFWSLVE